MMRSVKTLRLREVKGKTVLLRTDFNVEIVRDRIMDDYRMRASLPTVRFLLSRGAKLIILSHLGRPKRRDTRHSLGLIADKLSQIAGLQVALAREREEATLLRRTLSSQTIVLLENLRFWRGEMENAPSFAKSLAALGDFYVNDAFGVSHRREASVDAITKYIPSYAGLLLESEVKALERVAKNSSHPLVMIFGGKKLSDKIPLISRFLADAETILTGGGVANTFLGGKGFLIGESLSERALFPQTRRMMRRKNNIILPIDFCKGQLGGKKVILDIGPQTAKLYAAEIARARTIIWNGPLGFFENPKFAGGSFAIARAVAENRRAFSVIGGGETVAVFRAAVKKGKLAVGKNIFLSTGGGAMLEYLAGKSLPGIKALAK